MFHLVIACFWLEICAFMIQTPWWQKLRSYFTNWLLLILKIQDSKALSERTISSLVELKVAGHFVNPQKSEVKS
jgi:hypothetical protein